MEQLEKYPEWQNILDLISLKGVSGSSSSISGPFSPASPAPTFSSTTSDSSNTPPRQENWRPPGALAPIIPGVPKDWQPPPPDDTASFGFAPDYSTSLSTPQYRVPDLAPQVSSIDPQLQAYLPTELPISPPLLSPSVSSETERLGNHFNLPLPPHLRSPSFSSGHRHSRSVGEYDLHRTGSNSRNSPRRHKPGARSLTDESYFSGASSSSASIGNDSSSPNWPEGFPVRSRTSGSVHPQHSLASSSNASHTAGVGSTTSSINRERKRRTLTRPLTLHFDDGFDYEDKPNEDTHFFNMALLSHVAMRLKDNVPHGTHIKSGIPYSRAFTGKDIVTTIHSEIRKELLIEHNIKIRERYMALQISRTLQSQLLFYDVEWSGHPICDDVEDVYLFLDDLEVQSDNVSPPEREELPTGVLTMFTKCYSSSCALGTPCYSYTCPRRHLGSTLALLSTPPAPEPNREAKKNDWLATVDPSLYRKLSQSEIKRQIILHHVIELEEQYVEDLNMIETLYIRPLHEAHPPLIPGPDLEDFLRTVFHNLGELRSCNRRLLDRLRIRQREQLPVIQNVGDIFATAASEFRRAYPEYVGHLPLAEKRLKEEIESNGDLRRFQELTARLPESRRLDLKHFLSRPSEHLQRYPVLFQAIRTVTPADHPDLNDLQQAEQVIRGLSNFAQLRSFQYGMMRGSTAQLEWQTVVPDMVVLENIPRAQAKRQSIIFELIKTEMEYVRDLETIDSLFIQPLRKAHPPIIPKDRRQQFIQDVFHNYAEIHRLHRQMLDRLHEIQREEHPVIQSITAPVFDAALNWRDAYLEYIPNYPIAVYRVDEEMKNNPAFREFVERCLERPEARRLDIKAFINRPIPRLLRYDMLLGGVREASPPEHEDRDVIPHILEVIKYLGKATEPGVINSTQKVQLWKTIPHLTWKLGEEVDMDLSADTRVLIHTGYLHRPSEGRGSKHLVFLLDNYLVFTKPKEKDGVTKFQVQGRPIPLDVLSLGDFRNAPYQQPTGLFKVGRRDLPRSNSNASDSQGDPRNLYPLNIVQYGRLGGTHTLYAESEESRKKWKEKLVEAIGLRVAVQDSNKVFEKETLSDYTFRTQTSHSIYSRPAWPTSDVVFTGSVTCSVPFSTQAGHQLLAVGCAEGVWIGLRRNPRSLRRVLPLRRVTQCAMLYQFGIFLVLADQSLIAYRIDDLTTTGSSSKQGSAQKLNNTKDVQFFSVGTLGGRTLIIFMRRSMNGASVFRALEPVDNRVAGHSRGFAHPYTSSEWFQVYRDDFSVNSESYDVIFLKSKIAILCARGFEVMDLNNSTAPVTIPDREYTPLYKRAEHCRPIGIFRSGESEFLLCYNECGVYVDRYGAPSRSSGIIEWEMEATQAAHHPPYLLLFSSQCVEIRRLDTGRFMQFIPGSGIRCSWDGRCDRPPPSVVSGGRDGGPQESRIHVVMNAPEATNGYQQNPNVILEHIYELVPTIALHLPPSLSSPPASTYLPQY